MDKSIEGPCGMPKFSLGYTDWLRHQELSKGIVRISESICEQSVTKALRELSVLERGKVKAITLLISSPGGGAYPSFALYDKLMALRKKGTKITAIVEGWAASAAAMIILQAADFRYARPNARFLLHEIRRWVFFSVETTSDMEDQVEEMKAIERQIVKVLAKKCKKSQGDILRLIRRKEVWMSARESKTFGLIDKILK